MKRAADDVTNEVLAGRVASDLKSRRLVGLAQEAGFVQDGSVALLEPPAAPPSAMMLPPSLPAASPPPAAPSARRSGAALPLSPGLASPPKNSHKGLRHFSLKVCQQVQKRGKTTYKEVADALVVEFEDLKAADTSSSVSYEEKNIRRRVYDALNVLMAMDIIRREKKEIRWNGLPASSVDDLAALQRQEHVVADNINQHKQQLRDLVLQQAALRRLMAENTVPSAVGVVPNDRTVPLPFIVVSTAKDTKVQVELDEERKDMHLNFSGPFEVHDDHEILRRLGLQDMSNDDLKRYCDSQLLASLPPGLLVSPPVAAPPPPPPAAAPAPVEVAAAAPAVAAPAAAAAAVVAAPPLAAAAPPFSAAAPPPPAAEATPVPVPAPAAAPNGAGSGTMPLAAPAPVPVDGTQ